MTAGHQAQTRSFVHRKVMVPLVRMLRRGASPRRLAWSLAVGFTVGINPVIGSTTVLTIAISHLFKLNHSASQIGTHAAYPFQIVLFLPLLQAGTALFQSQPMPFVRSELLALMREHPLGMIRSLWMWEWHALVVWAGVALVLMPVLVLLLTRVLQRTLRHAGNNPHADGSGQPLTN